MIEEAITSLLTGNAAVNILIGMRLYPVKIPQDAALPAVAYQLISAGREYTQDGPSSLARPVIGFTIDSRSIDEARTVGAAIRTALNGYHGTIGTVKIGFISLQNEFEGYNLGSDINIVRQDYQIIWKEV